MTLKLSSHTDDTQYPFNPNNPWLNNQDITDSNFKQLGVKPSPWRQCSPLEGESEGLGFHSLGQHLYGCQKELKIADILSHVHGIILSLSD